MHRRLFSICMLAVGCSKSEPPPPERTEPWPAQPAASTPTSAGPEQRVKYRIEDRCELRVELPAREVTPRGSVRVARGDVDVDLLDLERTRGVLEVDVGSIAMDADGDAGSDDWTVEARSWLDLGHNRPEADRERQRWARYEITAVSELSSVAAHEGKRVALPADEDAGSDAGSGEQRAVTATLTGNLTLHGFRIERALRVRALFRYAAPAVRGAVPMALRVELARPLPVALAAHDIKPRDASGVFVAQKTKWLGTRVGREARVSGWLSALPAR